MQDTHSTLVKHLLHHFTPRWTDLKVFLNSKPSDKQALELGKEKQKLRPSEGASVLEERSPNFKILS
jgi:hypothetical protein